VYIRAYSFLIETSLYERKASAQAPQAHGTGWVENDVMSGGGYEEADIIEFGGDEEQLLTGLAQAQQLSPHLLRSREESWRKVFPVVNQDSGNPPIAQCPLDEGQEAIEAKVIRGASVQRRFALKWPLPESPR